MILQTKLHFLKTAFPFIVIALLVASCKHSPTAPTDNRLFITPSDYDHIILKFIDYDVLNITNEAGLDLRSLNIARISIGTKDSSGFKQLLSVPSSYDANFCEFIIHFDYTVTMDAKLIHALLTIRYLYPDSSYTDVDTSIDLYKYPYRSAQVFLTNSIIPYLNWFQDIDRSGSEFYFHVFGPDGLYSYDLNTKVTKSLFPYTSGDHIAADSASVYFDVNHDRIDRYDLSTGSVNNGFLYFSPSWIAGMAIFNQFLFVLVETPSSTLTLQKFTLGGKLIDSLDYSRNTYYITIYDSVVYSVDWRGLDPNQISRFDMRTKSFLPNVQSPAKSLDGIKAFGDQMYYCNFDKHFVGIIPFADLAPLSSIQQKRIGSKAYGRAPNQALSEGVPSGQADGISASAIGIAGVRFTF